MISLKSHGILLEKTDLVFENQAVLNPTCIKKDGKVHMFYRAVRSGNFSSIGYCQIYKDKVIERSLKPILVAETAYEKQGVEDPRITEVGGVYYLFYTAYDGKSALTACATSADLVHFKKLGLISPVLPYRQAAQLFKSPGLPQKYGWYAGHYQKYISTDVLLWEKDFLLFPEKINGRFLLLHRVMPGIQYLYFDEISQLQDPEFWRGELKTLANRVVLDPKFWFESRKIGGGAPPIKTPQGWLLIYHAVENGSLGRVYRAAAALLDLKDPTKVIGRLPEPLLSPHWDWEKNGDVNNVIFPTGAIAYGDELYIYYGAADTRICAASCSLSGLVGELLRNP